MTVDHQSGSVEPPPSVPAEALAVLRAFLDAGARQDEAAMRACLSKSTLESGSFNPSAAPQGLAFEVGEARREGAVVVADVSGREAGAAAGTPPALTLPCVLVEEDGAWKVDLKASMDRMFGGSVEEALESMVGTMAEAMKGVGEALAEGLSQAFSSEGGDPAPIPRTWEDAASDPAPEEVLPSPEFARLPVTEEALSGAVGSDVLVFAAIDELLAGAGSDDRDVLIGWFESALFAGWAAMLADVATRVPVSGRLRALRIEATSMPRDRMLALDGNDLVYRMRLPTDDGFFQDEEIRSRLAGVLAGLPDGIDPDLAGKRLLPRDDESPDAALYRDRVAPRLMRRISERLARPMALDVDWGSLADWPDATRLLWWWGLQRVLGGVSLAAAEAPLDRIRLVLDTERAQGGARIEGGTLTVAISPYGGDRAGPYEHEIAAALDARQ